MKKSIEKLLTEAGLLGEEIKGLEARRKAMLEEVKEEMVAQQVDVLYGETHTAKLEKQTRTKVSEMDINKIFGVDAYSKLPTYDIEFVKLYKNESLSKEATKVVKKVERQVEKILE